MANMSRRKFLRTVAITTGTSVLAGGLAACAGAPAPAATQAPAKAPEVAATAAPAGAQQVVALRWVDEGGWGDPADEQRYNDEI